MLFNSFVFIFFLIVVIPIAYIIGNRYRNLFLVFSSYVFYGYWDWRFCFLLAISTVIDFIVGEKLYHTTQEKKRKSLLFISLFANLGILGIFKYFNFFSESFIELAKLFSLQLDFLHLNIILPVGISFYTFQTMSYTIDIYRKKLTPTNSFIDFALFVAFFPQLVAGPIERASNLLPQLAKSPIPSKKQISEGITLIVTGLFRKVMIGDTAGRIVDHIFTNPQYYVSPELLMALVLFSIQIYADFSGYSSIARGTAKLLGIELMKNFEQPYLSANITEFWRRWHISLSTWLRDYLYISLGGNRKGNFRTYVNLMITMLLGGLWHGASWNFVIWGGLHGIYLAIHKWRLGSRKVKSQYIHDGFLGFSKYSLNVFFTYILVLITWLFFRARSFQDVNYFIDQMINWTDSEVTSRIITISISFLGFTLLYDFLQYYYKSHTFILKLRNKGLIIGILSALFGITCIYMFQSDPLPFVYFQF